MFSSVGGVADGLVELIAATEHRKRPGRSFAAEETAASEQETASHESTSTLRYEQTTTLDHAHFSDFIRKMVEVREILRTAGVEDAASLPSIVVIGSQSSGKSSVLECIVGHDFLPKGQNMVTRRPLELTLVHSPAAERDHVVISQHGDGPLHDFAQVQAILRNLNLAVPSEEWISNDPIRMSIHSKHVPDLTLVDLPGYIQISSRQQPPVLRDKIRALCDQYIRGNNIILAVCAADVDLANSEALKASRQYDPRGERTIGVITKLDLVAAEYAAQLVANHDYPLQLGYVGVVCRPVPASASDAVSVTEERSLLSFMRPSVGREVDVAQGERDYFAQHDAAYRQVADRVGFAALRRLLTGSLEMVMAHSLETVVSSVSGELEELRYQLKVQYNDRFVSPEAYVANLVSTLKQDFAQLTCQFTRTRVRDLLQQSFHQRLLQLCDEFFWNVSSDGSQHAANSPSPSVALPDGFARLQQDSTTMEYWNRRLDGCIGSFTRSGVGRSTANLIADAIMARVSSLLARPPFAFHQQLRADLLAAAETHVRRKCLAAIDQVENSMKPFRHGIEFTPTEWHEARNRLLALLTRQAAQLAADVERTKRELGPKRLRRAVEFLSRQHEGEETAISNPALARARETVVKSALLRRLTLRLTALRGDAAREPFAVADFRHRTALSTRLLSVLWPARSDPPVAQCQYEADPTSRELVILHDPCQLVSPEVYLYLVMERFLTTCSTFVHYELVSDFLQPFPDEMLSATSTDPTSGLLSPKKLSEESIRGLLRENPSIASHLAMQERYRALERALERLLLMRQTRTKTVTDEHSVRQHSNPPFFASMQM